MLLRPSFSTQFALFTSRTGLTHIDISQLVTEKGLDAGNDDERGCLLIDEDKVRLLPLLLAKAPPPRPSPTRVSFLLLFLSAN